MKFSTKLTASLSGIGLIIGMGVSYFVYTSNVNILKRQITSRYMEGAVHTLDKLDRVLFERMADIKVLATAPVLTSRCFAPKHITERLIEYRNHYKTYISLSFFDLNRVRIADTSGLDIGLQHGLNEYWHEISKGSDFAFDVSESESLHALVIHFSHVVKNLETGRNAGVVVSRVHVNKIKDIIGELISEGADVKLDLVNGEGIPIYSNYDRKRVLKDVLADWKVINSLAAGGKPANFVSRYLGEEVITLVVKEQGYLDYKGNGWVLVVRIPTKIALRPAVELRNIMIIVTVSYALFLIPTIMIFSRTVTKPLIKLKSAAIEIGKGRLDTKIDIASRDEIGALAESLVQMSGDLQKTTVSRDFMDSIIRGMMSCLFVVTPDGIIKATNPSTTKLLDYTEDEILNQPIKKFLDEELLLKVFDGRKKDFTGNTEGGLIAKDGKKMTVLFSKSVMCDTDGKIRGIVCVAHDITECKRLEEQQVKLREQLYHAQRLETVGKLAGGIAHEFNNLLTVIIGYGGLLDNEMKQGDAHKEYVHSILKSSEKAAYLTSGLLAFSRKRPICLKPVNLNNIIKEIKGLLLKTIHEDIRLSFNLSEKDLVIMADSTQIDQILINLAINAKDAMPNGGNISINTDIAELDDGYVKMYGFGKIGKYAAITFSDTGAGMDEYVQERMYEPFFTTKEVGKGTGLGLSIVYGIVKQHNGYINVRSEPDKGTTFRIYFPLSESATDETRVEEIQPSVAGTEAVLLAEDDEDVRNLVRKLLEGNGYRVIEAVDGEDALKKFMENKEHLQLLVLDVIMPGKNGKEVYNVIKKARPEMKALFMSGYSRDIIHTKTLINEGLQFISKPVTPVDFLKKVREILDMPV